MEMQHLAGSPAESRSLPPPAPAPSSLKFTTTLDS